MTRRQSSFSPPVRRVARERPSWPPPRRIAAPEPPRDATAAKPFHVKLRSCKPGTCSRAGRPDRTRHLNGADRTHHSSPANEPAEPETPSRHASVTFRRSRRGLSTPRIRRPRRHGTEADSIGAADARAIWSRVDRSLYRHLTTALPTELPFGTAPRAAHRDNATGRHDPLRSTASPSRAARCCSRCSEGC